VIDTERQARLESGWALIVGTVSAAGDPHAARGWGLAVLATDEPRVRLLLDADDSTTLENLAATGSVAITAAHVPTLRAMQCKGRATRIEPATADDYSRADQYTDAFFTDVQNTDGTARELLDRLRARDVVACVVEVDDWFDQTPGPGAGAPLRANNG
jgi:hypothetical protein